MEKQLASNQVEKTHGFKRLSKAADYLNSAAEIFEQAGLIKYANEVTEVLQSLAEDQFEDDHDEDVDSFFGLSKDSLNSLLESSTPAILIKLTKKVLDVLDGTESLSDELKKALNEHDLSDPNVREDLIDKLKTAMEIAKLVG